MGTSQSHSLKTTPQWSTAKKAMTDVIKEDGNEQKNSKLMSAFRTAISEELYRGGSSRGGGGSFGRAGSRALDTILQFILNVRSIGIDDSIDGLGLPQEERPQTPKELIRALCGLTSVNADALLDDEAAVEAQNKLLSMIFEQCDNLVDIESLLQQANEDTIDSWILDYEVEYIMEYMGELFQSHIFNKNANPETLCTQIKLWLRSQLDNLLANELQHINVFSPNGKAYIDTLTARILDIWQ